MREFPPLFQADATNLHAGYSGLRDRSDLVDFRKQTEHMWEVYAPYADPRFCDAFPLDFYGRLWELCFGYRLLRHGFRLTPAGMQGPDFAVASANLSSVFIEAISATPGNGPDRVPEFSFGLKTAVPVPYDKICLRIRSSIEEKMDQYRRWAKSDTIDPSKPFAIAVSVSHLFGATTNGHAPLCMQACLGVKGFAVRVDRGGSGEKAPMFRSDVQKLNGSIVATDIFFRESHAPLSGILISDFHLLGFPQERGGFEFLHNPQAAAKLPAQWLPLGSEYWVEGGSLYCRRHDAAEQTIAVDEREHGSING
ncbi:MAG: hypothetical protein L0Y67_01680 [Gammaproteobacteria bacterium]|nr:hypothetical protein [Gammaproteobacteria bacterium]